MRNRTSLHLSVAIIALLGSVGRAGALTLQEILPRLDAEDFLTREGATDDLIRVLTDGTDQACVERARAIEREAADTLRDADLSLEQRVRLTDALRRRFFTTPRGAMGVQFQQPQQIPVGVELALVMPGFPAADQGVLKAGDVVTAVAGISLIDPDLAGFRGNGMPLSSERLRHVVISHDPADTVDMTIIRPILMPDGRPAPRNPIPGLPGAGNYITEGPGKNADILNVKVTLGSFERLRQGNLIDRPSLEGAWKERARRLGIPGVPAAKVESPITLSDWNRHPAIARGPGPAVLDIDAPLQGADSGQWFAKREIQQARVIGRNVPIPNQQLQRAARTPVRNNAGHPALAQAQPGQPAQGIGDLATLMQNLAILTQRREVMLRRAADVTANDKTRNAAAKEAEDLRTLIEGIEQVFRQQVEKREAPAQPQP